MKIVQATGQTCNQFWIYSNFLADAIENNEKFAIWVPDISFEFFPNLLNSEFIIYPLFSKKIAHLLGYKSYIKIIKTIFLNKIAINISKFLINKFTSQRFIIAGVTIKKSDFKHKNLDKLLQIYFPSEPIEKKVNFFIENIRKEFEVIVGVHIRHGDYKTFNNGNYFYTLNEYANFMKKCEEILFEKKAAFFISSNEEIDGSFFTDFNCYYLPNGSMAEDLYCLSKTDYILGPPSTFSAWASLYNNTPLYFIETPKTEFFKKDFIDIKSIWF